MKKPASASPLSRPSACCMLHGAGGASGVVPVPLVPCVRVRGCGTQLNREPSTESTTQQGTPGHHHCSCCLRAQLPGMCRVSTCGCSVQRVTQLLRGLRPRLRLRRRLPEAALVVAAAGAMRSIARLGIADRRGAHPPAVQQAAEGLQARQRRGRDLGVVPGPQRYR
jgi:hypothetical protein